MKTKYGVKLKTIKIKTKLIDLKYFNWSLFIALSLTALVPAIYQTIRTFLISTNTSVEGIDVIGQMEWFDLINETLLAFLVVPLYSVFNKLNDNKETFAKYAFKLGILIFIVYLIFQMGVFVYANSLVNHMNPDDVDINMVANYLRIETIAFMVSIIYSVSNVIFIIVGKKKNVYILLITNAVMLIISDFVLIPRYGVMGVAYSNILVNGVIGLMSIVLLMINKAIKVEVFKKEDFKTIINYFKVGFFSGCQQLLDNLIYAVMVVKMVNLVAEQGNYWVANNFIWGWLLIPITALIEIIKRDSKNYRELKQSNYYFIIGFVVILWLITIPLWNLFFKDIENLENYNEIFEITLKLFPFYIPYALCIIPDNIFIGLGKTYFNAVNSVIINIVYYGIFYILHLTNTINFTLNTIIIMFGCGNVFHMVISYIEQFVMVKRIKFEA